jgi:hypothetical protein
MVRVTKLEQEEAEAIGNSSWIELCWSAEGLNVRRHTVHLVLLMYLIGFSHCSGKFKSSTPH